MLLPRIRLCRVTDKDCSHRLSHIGRIHKHYRRSRLSCLLFHSLCCLSSKLFAEEKNAGFENKRRFGRRSSFFSVFTYSQLTQGAARNTNIHLWSRKYRFVCHSHCVGSLWRTFSLSWQVKSAQPEVDAESVQSCPRTHLGLFGVLQWSHERWLHGVESQTANCTVHSFQGADFDRSDCCIKEWQTQNSIKQCQR